MGSYWHLLLDVYQAVRGVSTERRAAFWFAISSPLYLSLVLP